jgi:Flp pilus assembly protein TadD
MTVIREIAERALAGAAALCLALLAGCASQADLAAGAGEARGNKSAARQLYAGQPTVVHATEFPVESAAEGLARGDDAWRQGNLDLAVYLYVQSLAYDAATAEPFFKIGSIHEKLGNRALAEKAFELGLERDPGNVGASERLGLLYLESRNEAAERLLHAAVSGDPRRWRSYNGLGVLADRRGEYASAERHYDQAHLLQPDNASIINNRGYSHYLAGKLSAAEGDLRYAIALGAPAGTWTNLGKVLAKQGRFDEALESLLKESDTAHAYNVLGEAAREGGDLERARQYFSEAISAAPRYFREAQENLAEVDERLTAAAAPGSPVARVTPAGANTPAFGHADPMSVPVGSWLSQGKARAVARRQGLTLASRQAGKQAGTAP